ncbi:MAG: hypothetical protein GY834_11020, partial [Bacteroidetes bacterium]|nr:hypothetical protein [Bacteroidota bacterium]
SDFWFNGQEIIRIISPWVNFYKAAEVDLSQYERTSKKILGEIESMRDSARDNLFKLGGSYHTTDYFEEAKGWKKASNIWLIANIVLQVLSVGFVALLLYWLVSNPVNNIKAIDRLPYFAILALLYSAIFWCSRNYRASMHQYSVCKSKGVMLRTFQTFIDASGGDPEVKNAVLLTVTRSIFSHIDSGFSNSKETNIDLSSKILDVSKKT